MKETDWNYILNHLGEERENYYNAISPPVIQTSNFAFPDIGAFRTAIADELESNIYTRGNNPTVQILRKKIAALEGTEDALVTGSGAAAIAIAVISQVSAGDHVICVESPYSWTYTLLTKLLSRFKVEVSFVDGKNLKAIEDAINDNTKLLYLESPNTFFFDLQDLRACSALAKKYDLKTIVDNSYSSPYFQNPAAFGIDIIVHSATKYINGHSDVVAGIICGSKSDIKKIFDLEYMTLGTIIGPHDAALIIRGLRTLPLRLKRSHETAMQILHFLKSHPKIEKVIYPFDEDFPQYKLAKSQMRGAGGLLSFCLKTNTIDKAENFANSLKAFQLAVSWGGHESLFMPMVAFYNISGRENTSAPFNMVRIYIGLEDPQWLISDLNQALDNI